MKYIDYFRDLFYKNIFLHFILKLVDLKVNQKIILLLLSSAEMRKRVFFFIMSIYLC